MAKLSDFAGYGSAPGQVSGAYLDSVLGPSSAAGPAPAQSTIVRAVLVGVLVYFAIRSLR